MIANSNKVLIRSFKVLLFLVLTGLSSFNNESKSLVLSKRITVIGIALNVKGSAIVDSDKGFYVVDGLDAWEENYYKKKVKVTGRLTTIKHKKQSTDSVKVQEWVGKRRVIKKPKWEIIE